MLPELKIPLEFKDQLRVLSILRPDTLVSIQPSYEKFHLLSKGFRLWTTSETLLDRNLCLADEYGIYTHNNVLLLLSGPSASGKDALREELELLLGEQRVKKIITATSRPIRTDKGERDGIDYHFFANNGEILKAIDEGKFVESISIANYYYGSPKSSFLEACQDPQASIIVSHVEMFSGWPNVEKYIQTLPPEIQPKIVKVFVLPEMSPGDYIDRWLPDKRPKDYRSRVDRAYHEIYFAPQLAEFIVTNPIASGQRALMLEAKTLANYLQDFLPFNDTRIQRFDVPDVWKHIPQDMQLHRQDQAITQI